MGVRVDLIDRAVYSSQSKESQLKMTQDNSIFSERDKFLLSDHDVPAVTAVKQPKL